MPGAQCTRSLVCEVGSSKCTRVFTAVAPEITRHPRTQWFTAYFVLLCPQNLAECANGRFEPTARRWI
jgi:hypothetical protein